MIFNSSTASVSKSSLTISEQSKVACSHCFGRGFVEGQIKHSDTDEEIEIMRIKENNELPNDMIIYIGNPGEPNINYN